MTFLFPDHSELLPTVAHWEESLILLAGQVVFTKELCLSPTSAESRQNDQFNINEIFLKGKKIKKKYFFFTMQPRIVTVFVTWFCEPF